MRENAHQENYEYGQFLRSGSHSKTEIEANEKSRNYNQPQLLDGVCMTIWLSIVYLRSLHTVDFVTYVIFFMKLIKINSIMMSLFYRFR